MKSLLLPFIVLLLVGCADPGDKIINVTQTTGGYQTSGFSGDDPATFSPVKTINTSVKVSDFYWKKYGGIWVGKPSDGPHVRPADAEAVDAIEAYKDHISFY